MRASSTSKKLLLVDSYLIFVLYVICLSPVYAYYLTKGIVELWEVIRVLAASFILMAVLYLLSLVIRSVSIAAGALLAYIFFCISFSRSSEYVYPYLIRPHHTMNC